MIFCIPFMYLFALEIVIPYYEAGSVQGNVNNLIRALSYELMCNCDISRWGPETRHKGRPYTSNKSECSIP